RSQALARSEPPGTAGATDGGRPPGGGSGRRARAPRAAARTRPSGSSATSAASAAGAPAATGRRSPVAATAAARSTGSSGQGPEPFDAPQLFGTKGSATSPALSFLLSTARRRPVR